MDDEKTMVLVSQSREAERKHSHQPTHFLSQTCEQCCSGQFSALQQQQQFASGTQKLESAGGLLLAQAGSGDSAKAEKGATSADF